MTALFSTITTPLHADSDGTIRVAGTHMILDTLLECYKSGETPEQMAHDFRSLTIADIYAVIAYYHQHRDELDHYLAERQKQAEEIRKQIESTQGLQTGLKEELLHRPPELHSQSRPAK